MIKFRLKKLISGFFVLVMCGLLTINTPAQHRIMSPNDNTESDSFKLTVGSAFSAIDPPIVKKKKNGPGPAELLNQDIREALDIILKNHNGGSSAKPEKLVYSAIDSMLHTLDPHSSFYTPDEFMELLGEHQNEYYGTGATIVNADLNGERETFVLSVVPDSPASMAGLGYGDRIISVNDVTVTGLSSAKVREMIRGKLGTSVTIETERAETGKHEKMIVKRGRIGQKTVPHSFPLSGGTGYVDMSIGFSHSTATELRKAVDDLKIKGITSLILDLRGNGGGLVDQAAAVAEIFLGRSLMIASQKGRYPTDDRVWRSQNDNPEEMPLIVLVDSDTASAAEIVAGALQDNDRALIVGERTFGKGLVQSVLELENGAGLTLTAARYYTPSGRLIQRDYSNSGLYEYFSRTNRPVMVGESAFAARTLTNRTVYGGDGIKPDVEHSRQNISKQQIDIIDLSMLFVRSLMKKENSDYLTDSRQQLIFGKDIITDELLNKFREFSTAVNGASKTAEIFAAEPKFLRSQIRYDMALAAFGLDIAARQRINDDEIIAVANQQIGNAAKLSENARTVTAQRRVKEKGPLNAMSNEP